MVVGVSCYPVFFFPVQAFLMEVFSDEGKRIGACYALPTSLNDTFGRVGMPLINSNGRPIGQINGES